MRMTLRAYAKINPYLNITGRREDGYHELDIVFRPVTLYDTLIMEPLREGGNKVYLSCDKPEYAGEDNIIHKAYGALASAVSGKGGTLPGFRVQLTKVIPSGAGMGGGSSDAAAFLYGANVLAGLKLTPAELADIGAGVGADVPACLRWEASHGAGIGEKLTDIGGSAEAYYLIIKPRVSFPTPAMYKRYDELAEAGRLRAPKAGPVIGAMQAGDAAAEAGGYYNVFEKVVPDKRLITGIKKELISVGAAGAVMTGSGSCVVGTFISRLGRSKALRKLESAAPGGGRTYFTCENVAEQRGLHYVYMIECGDGSLYTGWTTDLRRRFEAHASGTGAKYTRSRGVKRLLYYECFDSRSAALAREYEIKQLTREEKVKLIRKSGIL